MSYFSSTQNKRHLQSLKRSKRNRKETSEPKNKRTESAVDASLKRKLVLNSKHRYKAPFKAHLNRRPKLVPLSKASDGEKLSVVENAKREEKRPENPRSRTLSQPRKGSKLSVDDVRRVKKLLENSSVFIELMPKIGAAKSEMITLTSANVDLQHNKLIFSEIKSISVIQNTSENVDKLIDFKRKFDSSGNLMLPFNRKGKEVGLVIVPAVKFEEISSPTAAKIAAISIDMSLLIENGEVIEKWINQEVVPAIPKQDGFMPIYSRRSRRELKMVNEMLYSTRAGVQRAESLLNVDGKVVKEIYLTTNLQPRSIRDQQYPDVIALNPEKLGHRPDVHTFTETIRKFDIKNKNLFNDAFEKSFNDIKTNNPQSLVKLREMSMGTESDVPNTSPTLDRPIDMAAHFLNTLIQDDSSWKQFMSTAGRDFRDTYFALLKGLPKLPDYIYSTKTYKTIENPSVPSDYEKGVSYPLPRQAPLFFHAENKKAALERIMKKLSPSFVKN